MKKILMIIVMFTLTICSISYVNAEEVSEDEMIRSFIYTFDGMNLDVEYVKDLKDIFGNMSYSLYRIEDNGYAVLTKNTKNIVEISYDNFPNENEIYYLSAGFFSTTLSLLDYDNTRSLNLDNEELKEVTKRILNEEHITFNIQNDNTTFRSRPYPNKPSVISGGTVVGIADSQMDIFNGSNWTNTTNQCGAYAAAVMITYMDKYHGGAYFKESGSYESGNIINRLKTYITGSSTSNQILQAINKIFLADYPNGGKHGTVTSSESTYKSKISSKYPVCLMLQSAKQSPYGNHWVCAYQYVDYNGALWFKAHDNWSGNNHRGWINRNWVYNGVYTN